MRTAAAVPERVGAGASFHGGRLVTDGPDSPHLLVPEMRASFLFAIAENDDEREPEDKDVLRQAFAAADLPAEIEVYEGALHGWCALDSAVYNEPQAERAWARLLVLLDEADLVTPERAAELRSEIETALEWQGPVYVVSALTGAGTRELVADVMRRLETIAASDEARAAAPD